MQRTIRIKTENDINGSWEMQSHRDGTVRTYKCSWRLGLADSQLTLFDREGRLAQFPVYINISEQGVDRPSFLATRGTVRVQRLYDGTIFGYEAEADFGERTPVNGKSKRDVADAIVSAQLDAFLASQRRSERKAVEA